MRTHPLNIGYLVVGLVFLGLSGSWALREAGVVDSDGVQWVLPATLVVAGVAGLLASIGKTVWRRSDAEPAAEPGDEPAGRTDELTYRYDEPSGDLPGTDLSDHGDKESDQR